VGPKAINGTRPDFNEVIRQTTQEQALLNVIRARNNEPTFFMDVNEVTLALQYQGSATAMLNYPAAHSLTSSGAIPYSPGHDYSLSGTYQIQETPTIYYIPVQGQALVQQVLTPIQVSAIPSMLNACWCAFPVLQMVVDRFAPADADSDEALAAIATLYDWGALVLAVEPTSAKSPATTTTATTITSAVAKTPATPASAATTAITTTPASPTNPPTTTITTSPSVSSSPGTAKTPATTTITTTPAATTITTIPATPGNPSTPTTTDTTTTTVTTNYTQGPDSLVLYFFPDRMRTARDKQNKASSIQLLPGVYDSSVRPSQSATTTAKRIWMRLKQIYNPNEIYDPVAGRLNWNGDRLELRYYSSAASLPPLAPNNVSDENVASISSASGNLTSGGVGQNSPVLLTRSALGVLRDFTHPDLENDPIVFVDADLYESGRKGRNESSEDSLPPLAPMVERFRRQINAGLHREFYVFDSFPYTAPYPPPERTDFLEPTPTGKRYHEPSELDAWPTLAMRGDEPKDDLRTRTYTDYEDPHAELGLQDYEDWHGYGNRSDSYQRYSRHYIIILFQNAKRPLVLKNTPKTSVVYGDERFYIDPNDVVSQDNFLLLAQLLTIQAVVQQAAPIVNSVSSH
jgi:hypothetical protein